MSKTVLAALILAASAVSAAQAANPPAAVPAPAPRPAVSAPAAARPAAAPVRAPGAAANGPLGGPLVKGVCLLSEEAVLANSKVAQAVNTRLNQLKAQAQAEVDAGRGPVDADLKTLQADAARTPAPPAADIQKRRLAIQARYQTLQDLADQRNREIEATRAKVLNRISADMQPVLAAVYRAHDCGLLFNRNAVLAGNMGGDLTGEVIRGLDAKITTMTFDREVLPPPAKK
jgi:Skp family chaperone for outer membrane proteins